LPNSAHNAHASIASRSAIAAWTVYPSPKVEFDLTEVVDDGVRQEEDRRVLVGDVAQPQNARSDVEKDRLGHLESREMRA
jgi:hypothetical protein